MTSRQLLQAVKKTWLDESEAQQLIDVLLNKQAGGDGGGGGGGAGSGGGSVGEGGRGWVDAGGKGQGGEVRLHEGPCPKLIAFSPCNFFFFRSSIFSSS